MTGPVWAIFNHPRSPGWTEEMRRTVLKEIVALVFTSFAIGSFVSDVSRNAELLDSLGGHLPGQN